MSKLRLRNKTIDVLAVPYELPWVIRLVLVIGIYNRRTFNVNTVLNLAITD